MAIASEQQAQVAVTSLSATTHSATTMHSTSTSTSPSTPTLASLPPELIDLVLSHIPPNALQQTTLALTRVIPQSNISHRYLYRHIRLTSDAQLRPVWDQLRRVKYGPLEQHLDDPDAQDPQSILGGIESFAFLPFTGDATTLTSILRLLPDLRHLILNVGTNFAPEHLGECFEVKRTRVRGVEIRFRPYVDKARYYQFLKGSYFDTAIDTITRLWPVTSSFTQLSLIQDIPPRWSVPHLAKKLARMKLRREGMVPSSDTTRANSRSHSDDENGHGGGGGGGAGEERVDQDHDDGDSDSDGGDEAWDALIDTTPTPHTQGYTGHGPFPYLSPALESSKPKTFAQPVVFHDIRCLARLACSPSARNIKELRLRCPGRDLGRVLTELGEGNDRIGRRFFPRLSFLDLSTTDIRTDGSLLLLLKRFPRLTHLILDRTNLFGFRGKDGGEGLCTELGIACAGLVGMQRGKEREREISRVEGEGRRVLAIERRDRERRERQEREAMGIVTEDNEDEDEDGNGDEEEEEEAFDEDGERIVRPPRARPRVEPVPEIRELERARPRRNRRTVAVASFSIRENTRRNRLNDAARQGQDDSDLVIQPPDILSLVLPPLSCLKSINLGGEVIPLDTRKMDSWERAWRKGWKEGLVKLYEWAGRVGERYERARKAADGWKTAEEMERRRTGGNKGGSSRGKKTNGTQPDGILLMPNGKPRTRPPLDVRLYRYPWPEEENLVDLDETNPYAGLVLVKDDENWKDVYLQYLGEAESICAQQDLDASTTSNNDRAIPVLCSIPDCEGPMRRGDGGERTDGRSGMKLVNGQILVKGGFKHRQGCGHLYSKSIWTSQMS